jgi:hypothetical protein
VIGEPAQQRRGSRAEGSGTPQALGRSYGLTPAVIRREEVEQVDRLRQHVRLLAFEESQVFEDYRTHSILRKRNRKDRATIVVTVR